jgi:hypothetical protein
LSARRLAAPAGINLFADPAVLNVDTPPRVFVVAGLAAISFGSFILRRARIAAERAAADADAIAHSALRQCH